MKITVTSQLEETPRLLQVQGIFDLPPAATSTLTWEVDLPLGEKSWHIGLITGPSGCGKSTISKRFWPQQHESLSKLCWPSNKSVLDAFPEDMGIKEVTELLSSVGFSSPPAWLRPFSVLSTGQQFRVTLARLLAEAKPGEPVVFDEYTSVVDRTVAKVGNAAVAKVIRQRGLQFIAVTCHNDVESWLQPDWTYEPAENRFAWRLLRQRPRINLDIVRCQASAWTLFAPHHYLSHELNRSAVCFLASVKGQPVAFSAWLPFVGAGKPARREHRTVCLPDFQGVGIGNAVSAFCASLWRGLGFRALSTTTHPAMIRSRMASLFWRMTRKPSFAGSSEGKLKHATTRLTAGFEYVGPGLMPLVARLLLED